jgi:hypothetical protein
MNLAFSSEDFLLKTGEHWEKVEPVDLRKNFDRLWALEAEVLGVSTRVATRFSGSKAGFGLNGETFFGFP